MTTEAEIARELSPATLRELRERRMLSVGSLLDIALSARELLNKACDGLSDQGMAFREALAVRSAIEDSKGRD